MEENDCSKLRDFKRIHLVDGAQRFREDYAILRKKGLEAWSDFSIFHDEEIIRIFLSRFHEDCLWLYQPYQILKLSLSDLLVCVHS